MIAIRDLQQLGLTDKEAAVYVAALGLGSASVQDIAKAARVKRPTAYLAIEALIRKGLMSSVETGKRRVFVSESPERLANLYASWANEIATKEQTLKELLPQLLALTVGADEKPRVLYYQGLEGLETMREVFLKTSARDMVSFAALDEYRAAVPVALQMKHAARLEAKGVGGRMLYASARAPVRQLAKTPWQFRRIPQQQYPFAGEVSVLGSRIAVLSYRPEPMGVMIQSQKIALMLTTIFELAWEAAARYQVSR